MKNKIIISPATWAIIAVSVFIAGYLYWFYTHFDKVIEEIDRGPIKEAKANPFYAAEKFLEQVGKTAQSQKNYSILDSELGSNDTLVIESTRVGLTETKREKIKNWLTSGGYLIVLATEVYDDELGASRDILLDELGIRLYENLDFDWDMEDDEQLTKLVFEGTENQTIIDLNDQFYLQDTSGEASYIGGNSSSDLFAQFEYGEGMVSIVTDMNIWKNYFINQHDHAMFLYQLIGGSDNVWFLYNTVQPSLISVMIEIIPMILISFVLLIIILLFSASWRKGPPKSDDLRIQREIMQHIEAAGEFSYRNDGGKLLVKGLMQSLESKLRISIHRYNQINDSKKVKKLSQLAGKKENEIAILWQDEERNQDDFIKKVVLIQQLKKQI